MPRARDWAVALTLGAVLSVTCSAQSFIVKDGQPVAEIVVAEDPPRTVKPAAEDLQIYIEKITGAKLPIVTQPSNEVPAKVYVGRSTYTDRLNLKNDDLKHGAYRIVSGDNWLTLIGRDKEYVPPEPRLRSHGDWPRLTKAWDEATGEKFGYPLSQDYKGWGQGMCEFDEWGSYNAVAGFLRMQGVRWYLPDELGEVVPEKASMRLPKIDKTVRPDFILRYPFQYGRRFGNPFGTREEVRWQLRMGFNRATDVICHDIGHGMTRVHSRDAVRQAHQEYFALYGGKRDTEFRNTGRPCLSSQGLLNANVRYVRKVFDILDVPMVSVMPSDGYVNLCQCHLCEGRGTPERGWDGQIADYVWSFVNRVAQEAYKTHPDKHVTCFAYGAYALPPEQIEKLSPNLVLGICQARRDFYDPKKRNKIAELRRAWLKKLPEGNKRFWLYEYYLHTNPRNRYAYMPVFFPHTVAQDLRSLKGICIGEFIDMYRNPDDSIGPMAVDHLNLYVTARYWWDTDQDIDALLDEYYTNFYGPAREEMKAFIEYSEANWMDLREQPEKIDELFELFDKAAKNAPDGSVYARRIGLIGDYVEPLRGLQAQLAKGRENVPEARAYSQVGEGFKLDGKLDEPFWQRMAGYGLRELQTGREPAFPTRFSAFWRNDALHFGIRCQEVPNEQPNIATTKDEDGNIWYGDCVEILLETQTHSYYQLALNPAGAMVDLDRAEGLNMLWSSQAEVATHIGDGYWSVEVRIPVAAANQDEIDPQNGLAGRRPTKTYPWYINVCRQRKRKDATEHSAFSPTGKESFHDTLRFARLYVR